MKDILKLGINGRPLCQSEMRGLARHTLELIKNLHALDPSIQFYVYTYGQIAPNHRAELPYVTFRESSPRVKIFWDLWLLPRALAEDGVKLFHSTNNLGIPFAPEIQSITTIHDDLTHRHRKTLSLSNIWGGVNYLIELWLLKQSRVFITVSKNAAAEIIQTMSLPASKMQVIYNGVKEYQPGKNVRDDFYLYVGGLEERKNIPMMIRDLEALQGELQKPVTLKLVSPFKTADHSVQHLLKNSRIRIELIENAKEAELVGLYQNCKALLFPSVYEGFGLPVVEAMKMGTPLVLSDIAVFQEITEGKAFFFHPKEAGALKNLLFDLESGKKHWDAYREKNVQRSSLFSWKKMAEETLAVYKKLTLGAL